MKFSTHFDAFLHFAEQQPVDREIDHSDWCHCAVGNYHDEATSEPPRNCDEPINLIIANGPVKSPLLEELEVDHRFIFEALNQGCVLYPADEGHEVQTYCGLAKFMREFKFVDYDDESPDLEDA